MMPKRQSVVCDGTVSVECTIFVQNGELKCSVGDYLALSPSNASSVFRERKYIVEVKSCAGKHLTADPVWPSHESVLNELSRSPSWKIIPFSNLVSFNRMLEALTKLCTKTNVANVGIFGELLSNWNEVKNVCEANSEIETRESDESSVQLISDNDYQATTVVDKAGGLLESLV